jgi:hypothetical protein
MIWVAYVAGGLSLYSLFESHHGLKASALFGKALSRYHALGFPLEHLVGVRLEYVVLYLVIGACWNSVVIASENKPGYVSSEPSIPFVISGLILWPWLLAKMIAYLIIFWNEPPQVLWLPWPTQGGIAARGQVVNGRIVMSYPTPPTRRRSRLLRGLSSYLFEVFKVPCAFVVFVAADFATSFVG